MPLSPLLQAQGYRCKQTPPLSVFTQVLEIQSYVFMLAQLALNLMTHFLGPAFDFINDQKVKPKGQVGLLSSHS